jgi:hypothetical protein
MLSSRLLWKLSIFALLSSCGSKATIIEECGEGMGRADDGICYPLAEADGSGDDGTADDGTADDGTGDDGTGDDGTGDDGTADDGTGDDGTGDDGTADDGTGDDGTGEDGAGDDGTSGGDTGDTTGTVGLSGKMTFDGTTTDAAICNISSWTVDAYDEETGEFDRTAYDEYDIQPVDCPDHTGGDIEFNLNITVDSSTDVLFFAFIDPDGDPSTTDYLAPATTNPMTVVVGVTYTDILFEMPDPE